MPPEHLGHQAVRDSDDSARVSGRVPSPGGNGGSVRVWLGHARGGGVSTNLDWPSDHETRSTEVVLRCRQGRVTNRELPRLRTWRRQAHWTCVSRHGSVEGQVCDGPLSLPLGRAPAPPTLLHRAGAELDQLEGEERGFEPGESPLAVEVLFRVGACACAELPTEPGIGAEGAHCVGELLRSIGRHDECATRLDEY